MSIENVWNYYKEIADTETIWEDPENKTEPNPLSLTFFFSKNSTAASQNEIVRAFLNDPDLNWNNAPLDNITVNDIRADVSKITPPYEAQMTAICNALNYPVSIVQGPPGTGKTEMILNLLAVIHKRYPQKTAAVVSSNNEAVKNIYDKISEAASKEKNDPVLAELYSHIAVLGNLGYRKSWCETMKERGLNVNGIFNEGTFSPKLLKQFKFFTSTIHSIRKIFENSSNFNNQFDFVIMDEASQTKIMLGIIAMSCSKQMVIIGDDKQLAPIIKNNMEEIGKSEKYNSINNIYLEENEKSFLSVCESVFGNNIKSTFLNEHYRCKPSIIGFCNKYVYDNALSIKTHEESFHIRAVWYDGDYCEDVSDKKTKIYNMRQINIFVKEELPRLDLMRKYRDLSIIVIAPFREQIDRLKAELKKNNVRYDENDSNDNNEALISNNIHSLTIHKAQGKGYDVVYMLTTEDYHKKSSYPWCQHMRMMNVAVSRAKKEFCIITSSQWLPQELRKNSANFMSTDLPHDLSDPDNMFFCKLLEYVKDNCPDPIGDYGFHKSKIKSAFDKIPYYRKKYHTGENCEYSAPAHLIFDLLENIASEYPVEENYCVLREVPLKYFELCNETVSCEDEELLNYAENAKADLVVCKGSQVRLILEVDGVYHRKNNEIQEKCDCNKDVWIKDVLDSDNIYLRLSTDGTSEDEETLFKKIIDSSVDSHLKIDLKKIKGVANSMRKQDIITVLDNRINKAFEELKEEIRNEVDPNCTDPDKVNLNINNEENCERLVNMEIFNILSNSNYINPQNVSYKKKITNNYYLCRYAKAYAFEYALMYDIVMRSYVKNGNHDQLGVFSFGCGSLIDALAMLYSKVNLCAEDECYEKCVLYYKGIDKERWDSAPFVYPQCTNSNDDPCQTDLDKNLHSEFEKIYFFEKDIIDFLNEKFIVRQNNKVYHNILFFPKILNELDDNKLDVFCKKFGEMRFELDEYYICVSHSKRYLEKGLAAVDKMVAAINRNNEFEVCSDIYKMIGDDEWKKFNNIWLNNNEIENNQAPDKHSCYEFKAIDYSKRSYRYIDNLNNDFKHNKNVIDYFCNKLLPILEKIEEKPRVNPITTVSQIRFQIIRLKKIKR